MSFIGVAECQSLQRNGRGRGFVNTSDRCSRIPPLGFRECRPLKMLHLCGGNLRRFSRHRHRKINNLSLLEPVTGNLNSVISQKNSLFFLCIDGGPWLAKYRELCSMPCSAMREREHKTQNFAVKFPVGKELQPERGLLETASTTNKPFRDMKLRCRDFRGDSTEGAERC